MFQCNNKTGVTLSRPRLSVGSSKEGQDVIVNDSSAQVVEPDIYYQTMEDLVE